MELTLAHEQLEVWQQAMELVSRVYKASGAFPNHEQFGLTAQLRRAAVSIPLNIAEGKGRYHRKEFVQFLYNARGSLYEVMTLLKLALELQYLSPSQYDPLLDLSKRVLSKLSGLINSLKN